jgi:hypothetical protein
MTGVQISVAGSAVQVLQGTWNVDDAINSISTCSFTVVDASGSASFTRGMQVSITDSVKGLIYTGFVSTAQRTRAASPNVLVFAQVAVVDNHYLAEKRTYQGPEYVNTYAGAIFADMCANVLASEGIVAQYASRRDVSVAEFNAGTLSNVAGTTNYQDADLELSPAGTIVTSTDVGFIDNHNNALKMTGYASQGYTNAYAYTKIWAGSQVVAASDVFTYDVWISSTSPAIVAGVDLTFSDGTNLRDNSIAGLWDNQGLIPHPATDLSGYANDVWYTRQFTIGQGSITGKTIVYATVAFESEMTGNYTAYFRNVYLKNGVTTKVTFYDTSSGLNANIPISSLGYSSIVLAVTRVFQDQQSSYTLTKSINAVGIVGSSIITFPGGGENLANPTASNTFIDAKATATVATSIDGGATYQAVTTGSAIPNLVAGMIATGRSVIYQVTLTLGQSPEYIATCGNLTLTVNPSYISSKVDVVKTNTLTADFAAGTYSNAKSAGSSGVTLNGFTIPCTQQSQYSGTAWGGGIYQYKSQMAFNVTGSGDAKLQLTGLGNWQDQICEYDVQVINTSLSAGHVYRTTFWSTANNTYAYSVQLTTTQLLLGRGTNSAGAVFTSIASVTVSLTANTYHHIKTVVVGSNHKIYLDDVLLINATDATFAATGGVGFRIFNNAAGINYQTYFKNFGICAALSGTWTSPALSIAAATTYGTSLVEWDTTQTPNVASISVQSSIDSGSTFQAVTQAGAISGLTAGMALSGKTVILQVTLSTSTASYLPIMNGITEIIQSQYSSSGSRISPTVSLANIVRLGSSLIAWNANLPTGCTLGVDTSVDGGAWTDVTASPGGTIPGLTVQPSPSVDGYATNSIANYASTAQAGGTNATWTVDTANSRISGVGGTNGLLLWSLGSFQDGSVQANITQAEFGGLVARYFNITNFYYVYVRDASAASGANTIVLLKVVSATITTLATASINFVRGTPHVLLLSTVGTTISASFDGVTLVSVTDSGLSASGSCGYYNSSGTMYSYDLYSQPLGQIATTHYVQNRLRLASTNPLYTPQITSIMIAAFGNTIAPGALIPQTAYKNGYTNNNFDDLIKQSATGTGIQYWWYIDKNKIPYFQPQNGMPAPWIASDLSTFASSSNPGDFLEAGISITSQSDLYRNRQIIVNVLAPATISELRGGNNAARSWTFGYAWAGPPVILVNGLTATVGLKGIDTGKQFYYSIGDATITEDASGPLYDPTFILSFSGPAQYLTQAQYDSVSAQTTLAALEGGTSGIVENVEDGTGLTYAAGLALAQARVTQYSVLGLTLSATTLRTGLAPGQLLTVFLSPFQAVDLQFLIRGIKTATTVDPTNAALQLFWYTIDAVSGPDLGDWTKLYLH